jgi:predicted nucleotidyltransferase
MTIDDIRRMIEPESDALRAIGVTALYVFGSAVRGDGGANSDVDMIVDFDPAYR